MCTEKVTIHACQKEDDRRNVTGGDYVMQLSPITHSFALHTAFEKKMTGGSKQASVALGLALLMVHLIKSLSSAFNRKFRGQIRYTLSISFN